MTNYLSCSQEKEGPAVFKLAADVDRRADPLPQSSLEFV